MDIVISSANTIPSEEMDESQLFDKEENVQKRKGFYEPVPKKRLIQKNHVVAVIHVHVNIGDYIYSQISNSTNCTDLKCVNEELSSMFDDMLEKLDIDIRQYQSPCSTNSNHSSSFKSEGSIIFTDQPVVILSQGIQEHNKHSDQLVDISDEPFKLPAPNQAQNLNKMRISSSTTVSASNSSSSGNRYSINSVSTESSDTNIKPPRIIAEDSGDEKNETIHVEESNDNEIKVYAKWKDDKYYYSGHIKGIPNPQTTVYFDDKSFWSVKMEDIFMSELLPINTEVMVDKDESGEFVNTCIITDHVEIHNFGAPPCKGYQLHNQIDDKTITCVKRRQVRVHCDTIRKLKSDNAEIMDDSPAEISCSNIMFGRRTPKPKRSSIYVSPFTKCHSPVISNLSKSCFTPVFKKKSQYRWQKERTISALFHNWYFMVTSGKDDNESVLDKKIKTEEMLSIHSGQIIEIDSDCMPRLTKIVGDFRKDLNRIALLVIGKDYQTVKYMVALAIGDVPIIDHSWTFECVKSSKILDFDKYLLPRGIDSRTGDIITQKLNVQHKSGGIFHDKNIWIITDNLKNFGENWEIILEIAGAHAYKRSIVDFLFDIPGDSCHFVIAERSGITMNCLRRLRDQQLTVVDISFAINSLVHNDMLILGDYLIDEIR